MSAREAYQSREYTVDYRNVKKSATDLDEMLGFSKGKRQVPVIVEDGRVTVGFGGT
jgi:glutaredoxin 3